MQMIGGNGENQFRQYVGQNAENLNGYNEVQNVGNQVAPNPRVQNVGNQNGLIGVQGNGNLVAARAEGNAAGQNGNQISCYNCRGIGHYARNCTSRPRRRDAVYLQTQLLIAQKEEAGIQLQAEKYDLMAAAANLDEIEEVNANCILMANLQQASSSGTQTDNAPVYDSDGSAEVHENYDDNEIFNMFTQEEQYTELLEPILESHQVPQNDNEVISEVTSVEQGGETVEQHPANFEETRALYDSLYQNLATEVEIQSEGDITDPTTAMNMALALMDKAFKLNYSTPTNNNQRISSNLRNRQIAQPGMNTGQDRQMQMVGGNANLNGNGNLVATLAEGITVGHNGNQIRCYNCKGKEEAGIQLQAEEFDLITAAADLDKIKEVNANCILMANLQQASTSGTQTDKAPVYDSDGSADVHDYENCYDNEIFNMFTQEEQYTELLEPIPEPHQVPQNDNDVIYEVTSMEQSGEIVEQHPANFEETRALYDSLYKNLAIEVKLVLSHRTENSFGLSKSFLSQASSKKKQSLYDGKLLLEKHDPPVVQDSEETLQLTQEGREKMKQLNKEIKPANYTKINHLSGIFVYQTAKSREELYFSNDSKRANVSKSISIPNEEFLDDTTPSVARKFLNEVKITIVTLKHVVKHKMTLETHNWSSSAHKELHKFIKDENFPIVNQVDARVQNLEIQFLKEAAKFVGDFKSLVKEADESLAKQKALELKIERLLRAVVSQDIMSVVKKELVVDTSNLQTELERMKERFENCIIKRENEYAKLWNDWYKKCDECKFDKISYDKAYNNMQQKIERLQAQLGDLKGKSKDTSCVSDTLNPLSQKLESENVELEF
nr:hypothetical protein [Tanacetum cinerariifolium]